MVRFGMLETSGPILFPNLLRYSGVWGRTKDKLLCQNLNSMLRVQLEGPTHWIIATHCSSKATKLFHYQRLGNARLLLLSASPLRGRHSASSASPYPSHPALSTLCLSFNTSMNLLWGLPHLSLVDKGQGDYNLLSCLTVPFFNHLLGLSDQLLWPQVCPILVNTESQKHLEEISLHLGKTSTWIGTF